MNWKVAAGVTLGLVMRGWVTARPRVRDEPSKVPPKLPATTKKAKVPTSRSRD